MILRVTLMAYYTILSLKRNFWGTDYYLCIVLFVFYFEQADGMAAQRLPCMSYQHTVLGTKKVLCK
jgi:hypothetical protein